MPLPDENIQQSKPSSSGYTPDEFLSLIRQKLPEYNNVPDDEALRDILGKYPEYTSWVNLSWNAPKKKVQDAFVSPGSYQEHVSKSEFGSSETLSKYKQEVDLFPDIYHKAKQMEAIFSEAESLENISPVGIKNLIKSGQITYTDAKGNPCAAEGLRNVDFTWGKRWSIIKDLKGFPSHADGGVDIQISGEGVRFKNNNGKEVIAANGLLLPVPDKDPKSKPKFEEYYATLSPEISDTTSYDLESAYNELPYKMMKRFATGETHLPDTFKKPTHPTFSDESKFHSEETPGGHWEQQVRNRKEYWQFTPSEFNIKNMGGVKAYKKWWDENQPDNYELNINVNLLKDKSLKN